MEPGSLTAMGSAVRGTVGVPLIIDGHQPVDVVFDDAERLAAEMANSLAERLKPVTPEAGAVMSSDAVESDCAVFCASVGTPAGEVTEMRVVDLGSLGILTSDSDKCLRVFDSSVVPGSVQELLDDGLRIMAMDAWKAARDSIAQAYAPDPEASVRISSRQRQAAAQLEKRSRTESAGVGPDPADVMRTSMVDKVRTSEVLAAAQDLGVPLERTADEVRALGPTHCSLSDDDVKLVCWALVLAA